jgi:hypothetical protein
MKYCILANQRNECDLWTKGGVPKHTQKIRPDLFQPCWVGAVFFYGLPCKVMRMMTKKTKKKKKTNFFGGPKEQGAHGPGRAGEEALQKNRGRKRRHVFRSAPLRSLSRSAPVPVVHGQAKLPTASSAPKKKKKKKEHKSKKALVLKSFW